MPFNFISGREKTNKERGFVMADPAAFVVSVPSPWKIEGPPLQFRGFVARTWMFGSKKMNHFIGNFRQLDEEYIFIYFSTLLAQFSFLFLYDYLFVSKLSKLCYWKPGSASDLQADTSSAAWHLAKLVNFWKETQIKGLPMPIHKFTLFLIKGLIQIRKCNCLRGHSKISFMYKL